MEKHYLGDLVDQKTQELTKSLEKVEKKVAEVSTDIKKLLPIGKQKHASRPLRDPITEETFQFLVYNADSTASYQKKIRQAQLGIAYRLLYHLGLRLNELRPCKLEDIQAAIKQSELRVILFKKNRSHN
jgi:integrase